MIESIGTGLTAILGWIGEFLKELLTKSISTGTTTREGYLYILLPLVGLGAAFSVIKFGIHIVRSFAFGF